MPKKDNSKAGFSKKSLNNSDSKSLIPKNRYDPDRTVKDIFLRYSEEVSPRKKGMLKEQTRLSKFIRDSPKFVALKVSEVAAPDIVEIREARLRLVMPSSVRREFVLLSNVFSIAKLEWHWITEHPMVNVKRPANSPSRERLFENDELPRLLNELGYSQTSKLKTKKSLVGIAILFAIETGMRAGEICGLEWKHVYLTRRFVQLIDTKNNTPRKVPLSPKAIKLLHQLEQHKNSFEGKVFGVRSGTLDATFRKAVKKSGIENLHFHDTRHEATTRLSKHLKLPALLKMLGLKDPRLIMVYYNETVEDIAKELADWQKNI